MQLPSHISYLIIGAGVHGLSTAWHLAKELKARGKGSGEDIIVVDSALYPFRYGRYAAGDLHPTSHSPFPWS